MRRPGIVEVVDSLVQQAPNRHRSPWEIVGTQEFLKPAKDTLNHSAIPRRGDPGHALGYVVLFEEIGIAGRRELRPLIAAQDELSARRSLPRQQTPQGW